MKKYIKGAVLLSILSSNAVYAVFDFSTPNALDWRGTFHWFLPSPEDAWWHGYTPSEKMSDWEVRSWSAGYARNADKAFSKQDSNKVTTKTASLATLFFGKEVFRGEEAFTNGTFAAPTGDAISPEANAQALANLQLLNRNNPFVGFAKITPSLEYFEYGAYWGIDSYYRFGKNKRWYAGFRVDLPFKVTDLTQELDSTEEEIGDVVRFRSQTIDNSNGNDFAARFDFLSTLLSGSAGATANTAFVQYRTDGRVVFDGLLVSGTSSSENGVNVNAPAAYATVSADGELPIPSLGGFKKQPSQVSGPLPANGSINTGATLFMQTGTDYAGNLAQNRDEQGQLFFVPRTENGTNLTANANAISQAIAANFTLSMDADENASDFFKSKGIDIFAHERVVAVGDLDAEAYVGYGDYATWFGSGVLGFRFPTGKKSDNSNKIYFMPTGNNGHFEIKLALDGGWRPREWFAFEIDAQFHHAFKRTENRAAAFQGATIRNIGPSIDAKVSWSYFVLRTDFSFFHPQNPDLGFCAGYELFAKGKDRVSFEQTTATDLFGRAGQPLDASIYENRTNTLSNKIHGQMFHRWNFFELFAGGSQVFAGRNVMKETEAHVGFVTYF